MPIRTNFISFMFCATSVFLDHPLLAQAGFADLPDLSHVPAIKDAGPARSDGSCSSQNRTSDTLCFTSRCR